MSNKNELELDLVVDTTIGNARQALSNLLKEVEKLGKAGKNLTGADSYRQQQRTLSKIKKVLSDIRALEGARKTNITETEQLQQRQLQSLTTRSALLKRERDLLINKNQLNAVATQADREQLMLQKRKAQAEERLVQALLSGNTRRIKYNHTVLDGLRRQEAKNQSTLRTEGLINKRIQERAQVLRKVWSEQDRIEKKLQKEAELRNKLNNPGAFASEGKLARNKAYQTRFGDGGALMFSTIGAVFGQYQIFNGILSSLSFAKTFIVELDKELTQLQAITAATNTEMVSLKKTIIDVSEKTKFTAVDVAQAATILGQAGFSIKEIEDSLASVSYLATATGSDLKKAADVITSSLSVFQLQATETAHVANVLTGAINKSKLTMDKLALGIQFASNIAYQSGVQFEELVSILGGLANAGVRSGSTIGTGVRQLLIDLQNPTKKYEQALHRVGLTLNDVDIKTHSFVGILEKLKDAGFGSAEAMQSFEVRASAAFSALANQLDSVRDLQAQLYLTDAATEAANVQMKSFSNTFERFKSVAGTVVDAVFNPMLKSLTHILDVLVSVGTVLKDIFSTKVGGAVIQTLAVFASGAILVRGATLVGRLAKGLFELSSGFKSAAVGATLFARTGTTAFAILGGWPGIIISAVTALSFFTAGATASTEALDAAKTAVSKYEDQQSSLSSTTKALQQEINSLIDRESELKSNKEALGLEILRLENRFVGLSGAIVNTRKSYGDLLDALRGLKGASLADQLNLTSFRLSSEKKLKQANLDKAQSGLHDLLGTPYSPGSYVLQNLEHNPAYNANIQKGLGPLDLKLFLNTLKKFDPSNTNSSQIGQLKDQFDQLNKALKSDSISSSQKDSLAPIQAAVSKIISGSFGALSSDINIRNLKSEKASLTSQNTPLFKDLSKKLEDLTSTLKQAENSANRDSSGNILGARSTFTNYKTLTAKPFDNLLKLEEQLLNSTLDKGALAELKARVGQLRSEYIAKLEKLAKGNFDAQKEALQLSSNVQKRIIERAKKKAGNTTDIGEYDTAVEEVIQAGRKYVIDQLTLWKIDPKNQLDPNSSAEDKQRYQKKLADKRAELRQVLLRDVESVSSSFSGAFKDYLKGQFQPQLLDLKKRQVYAKSGLNQINTQIQASQRFKNKGNVSQADAVDLQIRKEKAEEQYQRELLKIFRDQASVQSDQLNRAELYLSSVQKRLSTEKLSSEEKAVLLNKEQQTTNEINNLKTKRLDLDKQIVQQQALVNSYKEVENKSLREELKLTVATWKQTSGIMDSMNKTLGDGLYSALSSLQSGFKQLFMDIGTGSKSAGDAFRAFGQSVVDSLLNIVATFLANQILMLIIGAFTGAAAGGLTGGFNAAGTAGGNYLSGTDLTLGGSGVASTPSYLQIPGLSTGGPVPGVPTNRDSVLTYLQPGEFVVKKSAVDAVGTDYLHQLNTKGAAESAPKQSIKPVVMGGGNQATTNVYVVAPEQKPIPGPNDILMVVNEDISTGGTTKKLIKQIVHEL